MGEPGPRSEPSGEHRAVEVPFNAVQYRLGCVPATLGDGQIGDDVGLTNIDADDLMSLGALPGGHRAPHAGSRSAHRIDPHECTPFLFACHLRGRRATPRPSGCSR